LTVPLIVVVKRSAQSATYYYMQRFACKVYFSWVATRCYCPDEAITPPSSRTADTIELMKGLVTNYHTKGQGYC
jgi:hypothetical protein